MNNKRIQPLFSIAVVSFSLILAGGGTYMALDQHPKQVEEVKPAPQVVSIPTVEVPPPTPEPVVVNVAPVEAPKPKPVIRSHPKVKVAQKVSEPAQPCDLVCEDEWHDSLLFAQGGRYKNCKCK